MNQLVYSVWSLKPSKLSVILEMGKFLGLKDNAIAQSVALKKVLKGFLVVLAVREYQCTTCVWRSFCGTRVKNKKGLHECAILNNNVGFVNHWNLTKYVVLVHNSKKGV